MTGAYGRMLRRALAVLIATLCLYGVLVVVIHYFGAKREMGWGTLYDALQMLFANRDPEKLEDESSGLMYFTALIAPWVLALFGVIAVVNAVLVRFKLAWFRTLSRGHRLLLLLSDPRDLIAVIGLGEKGLEMAREELSASRHVVVLEPSAENPFIAQIESEGATVWIGDGRSEADLRTILWKLPTRIWIMTGDSRRNLLILDQLRRQWSHGAGKSESGRVDIHAHIADFSDRRDAASLIPLNDDRPDVWTHLFNQEEAIAAWLLRHHPVRVRNGRPPRVLLIGLGPIGRAIFRELLILCHFPESFDAFGRLKPDELEALTPAELSENCVPEIVTIENDETAVASLYDELPFLRGSMTEIGAFIPHRMLQEDAQRWVYTDYCDRIRQGALFTHVFIAAGADSRNLALAQRIYGWERFAAPDVNSGADAFPRIVPIVYEKEALNWASVGPSGMQPFFVRSIYEEDARSWNEAFLRGMAMCINDVYGLATKEPPAAGTPEDWEVRLRELAKEPARWREELEKIALAHLADKRFSETQDSTQVEDSWTDCLEDDRRSSLAQARYLFNRFHLDASEAMEEDERRWIRTLVTSSSRDFMLEAACEHRRWSAFMLVEHHGRIHIGPDDEERRSIYFDPCLKEKVPSDVGTASGLHSGHPTSVKKEPKTIWLRKLARVNCNLVPFGKLDVRFRNIDFQFVAAHEWIKREGARRIKPREAR